MALRARNINHLIQVRRAFNAIENCPLITSTDSDYPYRIIITRRQAEQLVQWLVADIDFDNFKNAVGAKHGHNSVYVECLLYVWQVARDYLQPKKQGKRNLL